MKKTWILLVLAALLVFALAMPATASVTDPHCACGATTSGTTCASCGLPVYSDWKEWDLGNGSTITMPSGRYYLTSDLVLAGELIVADNAEIVIDLNGFDIYAGTERFSRHGIIDFYKNGSTATSNANVTITDTSANNTGELLVAGVGSNQSGGNVVRLTNGPDGANTCNLVNVHVRATEAITTSLTGIFFTVPTNATLNIYNAKIDASNVTAAYGVMSVVEGTVTIDGADAVLTGGTATSVGGGVFLLGGNMNTSAATLIMKNGTIQNGKHTGPAADNNGGGNIHVFAKQSKFYFHNGKIKGGSADKGGNVFNNGTTYMYNGTIEGGSASQTETAHGGGNVYCMQSSSKFYMYDGTIQNGTATGSGGNVFVRWGTFEMSDGLITNRTDVVTAKEGGNIGLSFNAAYFNMSGGTVDGGYASEGGGSVTVNKQGGNVTISGDAVIRNGKAQYGGAFNVNSTAANVQITGGTIYGGTATSTGTGGGAMIIQGGAVTMTGGTIYGGTAKNGGAVLMYNSGNAGSFTMDGANAKIIGGTASDNGGVIKVQNAAKTVTLKNGTIDGTDATAKFGVAVSVADNGNFVMEGGTLTGGNASGSCGGTIALQAGKVTISGGTVNGGTLADNATYGGGTFAVIHADANMTISGGTINGGTAKRGSCGYMNAGTVNITGGTVKALSKFGGTLNVSGAPELSLALGNDQSFNIPAAITSEITVSHDDWADVIAVAASKTVADTSMPNIGPYPNSLVLENDTNIRMAVFQIITDGVKGGLFSPASTLAGGANVTYKMTYNMERAYLSDMADGTVVDLNGFTLTLTDATQDLSNVILVDSSAAGYTAGTGKVVASGVTGQPKRAGVDTATKYRYVTILDGVNYTAHRIYVGIKSAVLNPYGPSVNFRTILKCDDVVAAKITQHGAKFTGDNTATSASTKEIVPGKDATNEWLTTLANASAENFTKQFDSYAFFTIADGMGTDDVRSSTMPRSIKAMVEYGDTNFATLTATQQTALVHMYKTYSSAMADGWSVGNIAAKANGGNSTT